VNRNCTSQPRFGRKLLSWFKWRVLAPVLFACHVVQTSVIGWMRRRGWRSVRSHSALAMEVVATSIGSLGDQAMVGGLVEILKQDGVADVGIVTFGRANPWSRIAGTHHAFALDGVRNSLLAIWRMSAYERIYYPGADVIDGTYSDHSVGRVLHLATMASRLGMRATICGFSFRNAPHPLAVEHIRRLPEGVRLCCRDALSQRRLQQILSHEVELVADLAFSLPPEDSSPNVEPVRAWINQQRAEGRQILGVNMHKQLLHEGTGVSMPELQQAVAKALQAVAAQRKVAFVFIPHDYRSARSDVAVLRELREVVDPALHGSIMLIEQECVAGEVKAIAGMADLVLSGRMHLTIATLGQGVPVVCLTYFDKFEGLMQHFALVGNLLSPQEALAGDRLGPELVDHLDRCEALKAKVRESLPRVMEMSRANA
jgi:polysaccharide pyruvyl transferase WcaK-like protein